MNPSVDVTLIATMSGWEIALLVLACVFLLKLAKRKIGSAVVVAIAAIVIWAGFVLPGQFRHRWANHTVHEIDGIRIDLGDVATGPQEWQRELEREMSQLQAELASQQSELKSELSQQAQVGDDAAKARAREAAERALEVQQRIREAEQRTHEWSASLSQESAQQPEDLQGVVESSRAIIAKLKALTSNGKSHQITIVHDNNRDGGNGSDDCEAGDVCELAETKAEVDAWPVANDESTPTASAASEVGQDDGDRPEWVDDIELNGYQWNDRVYRTRIMVTSDKKDELDQRLANEINDAITKYSLWFRSMEGLDDDWYDKFPYRANDRSVRKSCIAKTYETEQELEIGGEVWPVKYALLEFDGKFQRRVQAHFDQARSLARTAQTATGFGGILGGLSLIFGCLWWTQRSASASQIGRGRIVAGLVAVAVIAAAVLSVLPAV